MSSYIILTPEIGNMGGGQMYTNNKVKYLKEHGWNVHVFYFKGEGTIKMPFLKEYDGNIIREFRYAFYYVPVFRRKAIADRINQKIKGDDKVVIESQLIDLAFWGEDIAQRVGANHIINFIEEQIPWMDDRKLRFFEFKLMQWQMLNSGLTSQKRVFKDKWKPIYTNFCNQMSYKCTNVVHDVPFDISFATCDYTILTIGRLDKPYIDSMTKEFLAFVQVHPNKVFNIIYVGGSPDGSKEAQIPIIFKEVANVNVYMLGYTFPIPLDIIKKANVAVASANSVLVTSDLDIPTISLDMNDYQAIGVYGYDTSNKLRRGSGENPRRLTDVLADILLLHKYPKKGTIVDSMKDVNCQLDCEISFLEKSGRDFRYYDLKQLNSIWYRVFCRFKWFVHQFINWRRAVKA